MGNYLICFWGIYVVSYSPTKPTTPPIYIYKH